MGADPGSGGAVDLKSLGISSAPASAGAPPQPVTRPYDPAPAREKIRGIIALRLVYTLITLVVAAFLLLAAPALICTWTSCQANALAATAVKDVVQLLLTPIVGLVGAVAGFYFGEKSAQGR